MSDCLAEVTKFSVTFGKFRKCNSVSHEADLYDLIQEKFKSCPKFLKAIQIQFEEEGVDEFVNLDSPLQLSQRKSNRLLVLADSSEKDTILSESESDSDYEDEPV